MKMRKIDQEEAVVIVEFITWAQSHLEKERDRELLTFLWNKLRKEQNNSCD